MEQEVNMTEPSNAKLKNTTWAAVFLFLLTFFLPASSVFAGEVQDLKQELQQLTQKMMKLEEKLDKLEKAEAKKKADIQEMDQRISKNEIHTATDKLSFGFELRSRVDSIHYKDMLSAPAPVLNGFFSPPPAGFNGATAQQIQQGMAAMAAAGMVPAPDKQDVDNNIIYTNRFRLNMKAKINNHLNFAGRMAAYKVFGDSTGVNFNNGSLNDVAMDGNTTSLPHGDTIRLERAYFNYHRPVGDIPINISLGRRPSTEGPPMEYRNYSLEGGSPLATIINWQFDGASLNFGLEDVTGIPGAALKFCYGLGFEGGFGNASSLGISTPEVDDVHLAGFIATLYDDDVNSLVFSYARGFNITDGFTGLTVMPFIVSKNDSGQFSFTPNSGAFISRMEPTNNIGDWDAASMLFRTNFADQFADIDFFVAGSWSHTDPSDFSKNPFYELMGVGLLSSNGQLESHNGYSVYTGAIFPMPFDARLGIEYNYRSKYWFPFTGAEDSLVASKIAARGNVFEAYYIQPIYKDNFFLQLGGQYYDYDYTGSGNPLGAPVKISEATAFDTLFPVIDKVWVGYLSATVRF